MIRESCLILTIDLRSINVQINWSSIFSLSKSLINKHRSIHDNNQQMYISRARARVYICVCVRACACARVCVSWIYLGMYAHAYVHEYLHHTRMCFLSYLD